MADLSEILERFLQPHLSYAVRSSGIHEDGENISGAGQNETVLNVSGSSQIAHALKLCWASLFSFRSVKYRRQHGLAAVTSMGVIIQEMAPAQIGGVMFSRHPVTGDPSLILINATAGLGDGVVSGSTDPDSITVQRDENAEFSIVGQRSGSRNNASVCLSTTQIMELCKVCVNVESIFGFSCDIEWAVNEEKIYLLQARPITSTLVWSDFEIIHEFDSPYTEDDISTTYNVGEVYPSATTPLTLSTLSTVISIVQNEEGHLKRINKVLNRYKQNMASSHHRLLLDLMMTLFQEVGKDVHPMQSIAQLVLSGKVFANENMYALAAKRYSTTKPLPKIFWILLFLRKLLSQLWSCICLSMQRGRPKCLSRTLEANSSGEVFPQLCELFESYQKVMLQHLRISSMTVVIEMLTIGVLTGMSKDFTEETFSDISRLITTVNKDVYSLKMPLLLEKICTFIKKSGVADEFSIISADMGQQFLRANCPNAYLLLNEFLENFGHRGISELELMAENWLTKPDGLIEMLQRLVKTDSPKKPEVEATGDLTSVIQSLKTPLNNFSRQLLRVLTPAARKCVELRELSKNEAVREAHRLRVIFIALGKTLASEGRIPEPSFVYFMSFAQLIAIMRSTDIVILQKALRRKKLWPTINNLTLPEVVIGWPLPVVRKINLGPGACQVKGMPVFLGEASGRACVVRSLDDCIQIKDGDILVTTSIDIGWSPYFPLLRGIVVEMGGLLSHGVVIAREYGLPSLVNAMSATDLFNTGDVVFLDAKNGVLTKVSTQQLPPSQENLPHLR